MSMGFGRLYVLVNSDLKMSTGKIAAQTAHAVARLEVGTPKVVIVLTATSWQLIALSSYLKQNGIERVVYIDEGVNEVPPMSATTLAFWVPNDHKTPEYMRGFKLLKSKRSWL